MKKIKLYKGTSPGKDDLEFTGYLIRESNPRLAICQDRVCKIDRAGNILLSIDLLELIPGDDVSLPLLTA